MMGRARRPTVLLHAALLAIKCTIVAGACTTTGDFIQGKNTATPVNKGPVQTLTECVDLCRPDDPDGSIQLSQTWAPGTDCECGGTRGSGVITGAFMHCYYGSAPPQTTAMGGFEATMSTTPAAGEASISTTPSAAEAYVPPPATCSYAGKAFTRSPASYVQLDPGCSNTFGGAFSISLSVKHADATFARFLDFGHDNYANNIALWKVDGTSYRFFANVDVSSGNNRDLVFPGVQIGVWQDLMMTVSETGEMKAYINGALVASLPANNVPIKTVQRQLTVGARNGHTNRDPHEGEIRDLKYWVGLVLPEAPAGYAAQVSTTTPRAQVGNTSEASGEVLGDLKCFGSADMPAGLGQVRQVDSWYHYCAVLEDKTVRCWGSSGAQVDVPGGMGPAKKVVAGSTHSCALLEDKSVVCWGTGSKDQHVVPSDLGAVLDIDAGFLATCVILYQAATPDVGPLQCWGHTYTSSVPTGNFKKIAVAGSMSCGIKEDDTIECFGHGSSLPSTPPTGRYKNIAAAMEILCATTMSGDVDCLRLGTDTPGANADLIGVNRGEKLCHVSPDSALTCQNMDFVPAGVGRVRGVAVGSYSVCVIQEPVPIEGGLHCDGESMYGTASPPGDLGEIVQVSMFHHACAVTTAKKVRCWGTRGTAGTGVAGIQAVPSSLTSVKKVAVGAVHSCALTEAHSLTCWMGTPGEHVQDYGQATVPMSVGGGTVLDFDTGLYHTCAVMQADPSQPMGTLECWGNTTHSAVPSDMGSVKQVACGWTWSCVLKMDDTLRCFGQDAPTTPGGTFQSLTLTLSSLTACAVATDGSVSCFAGATGSSMSQTSSPPSGCANVGAAPNQTVACLGKAMPATLPSATDFGAGFATWRYEPGRFIHGIGTKYAERRFYFHEALLLCVQEKDCTGITCVAANISLCTLRTGSSMISSSSGSATYHKPTSAGQVTCFVGSTKAAASGPVVPVEAYGPLNCAGGNGIYDTAIWPTGSVQKRVKQVSMGFVTCVIQEPGNSVMCWGGGMTTPAQLTGAPTANNKKVSAGAVHFCYQDGDNYLRCSLVGMKMPDYGQATRPNSLGKVMDFDTGMYMTCAIQLASPSQTAGPLVCWGNSTYTQAVPANLGNVKSVACGFKFSCVVKEDDSLLCFGDGAPSPPKGSFRSVTGSLTGTFCATALNGGVHCFAGHSGSGTISNALSASADQTYGCGVTNTPDQTVSCFGDMTVPGNLYSASGYAIGIPEWSKTAGKFIHGVATRYGEAFFPFHEALALCVEESACTGIVCSADNHERCNLRTGYSMISSGSGSATYHKPSSYGKAACFIGEAMPATTTITTTPKPVLSGKMTCVGNAWNGSHAVSSRSWQPLMSVSTLFFGCATEVDNNRFLRCWTGTRAGGTGARIQYTKVRVGGAHVCALRSDKLMTCRLEGPLKQPDYGQHLYYDSSALGSGAKVMDFDSGMYVSCAIRETGTGSGPLVCWGNTTQAQVPSDLGNVKAIACGWEWHCVVKEDDTLRCFGQGAPTPPSGLYRSVSGTVYGTFCAVALNGTVTCFKGQSGGATVINDLSTPSVSAMSGPPTASGGCAVDGNQSVSCWGDYQSAADRLESAFDVSMGIPEWPKEAGKFIAGTATKYAERAFFYNEAVVLCMWEAECTGITCSGDDLAKCSLRTGTAMTGSSSGSATYHKPKSGAAAACFLGEAKPPTTTTSTPRGYSNGSSCTASHPYAYNPSGNLDRCCRTSRQYNGVECANNREDVWCRSWACYNNEYILCASPPCSDHPSAVPCQSNASVTCPSNAPYAIMPSKNFSACCSSARGNGTDSSYRNHLARAGRYETCESEAKPCPGGQGCWDYQSCHYPPKPIDWTTTANFRVAGRADLFVFLEGGKFLYLSKGFEDSRRQEGNWSMLNQGLLRFQLKDSMSRLYNLTILDKGDGLYLPPPENWTLAHHADYTLPQWWLAFFGRAATKAPAPPPPPTPPPYRPFVPGNAIAGGAPAYADEDKVEVKLRIEGVDTSRLNLDENSETKALFIEACKEGIIEAASNSLGSPFNPLFMDLRIVDVERRRLSSMSMRLLGSRAKALQARMLQGVGGTGDGAVTVETDIVPSTDIKAADLAVALENDAEKVGVAVEEQVDKVPGLANVLTTGRTSVKALAAIVSVKEAEMSAEEAAVANLLAAVNEAKDNAFNALAMGADNITAPIPGLGILYAAPLSSLPRTFGAGPVSITLSEEIFAIESPEPDIPLVFSALSVDAAVAEELGGLAALVMDLQTMNNTEVEVPLLKNPVAMTLPVIYNDTQITCAYWNEDTKKWSTWGVRQAAESRAALEEEVDLICETFHFSLFGAILQGIVTTLACANFNLLRSESIEMLGKGDWHSTLGARCVFIMLGGMVAAFIMAAILDGHRRNRYHWRDEFFLVPERALERAEQRRAEEKAKAIAGGTAEREAEKPEGEEGEEVQKVGTMTKAKVGCLGACTACCACSPVLTAAFKEALDDIMSSWFEYFAEVRELCTMCGGTVVSAFSGRAAGGVLAALSRASDQMVTKLLMHHSRRGVAASLGMSADLVSFILEDEDLRDYISEERMYRKDKERAEKKAAAKAKAEAACETAAPEAAPASSSTGLTPEQAEKAETEVNPNQEASCEEAQKEEEKKEATKGGGDWFFLDPNGEEKKDKAPVEPAPEVAAKPSEAPKASGVHTWREKQDQYLAWRTLRQEVCEALYNRTARPRSRAQHALSVCEMYAFENPIGALFVVDIFQSSKQKVAVFCSDLLGSFVMCAVFFQGGGMVRGRPVGDDGEDMCANVEDGSLGFRIGRFIVIATASLILASLPVSLLESLMTKGFKKMEGEPGSEAWVKQLRAWKIQEGIFWVAALIYDSFCAFYLLVFIANISPEDHEDWTTAGGIGLFEDFLAFPLFMAAALPFAARVWLRAHTWAHGMPQEAMVRKACERLHSETNMMLPVEEV